MDPCHTRRTGLAVCRFSGALCCYPTALMRVSSTDCQGAQQLRVAAREDIVRYRLTQVAADVTHWLEYDYCLVNKSFEASVTAVRAILAAERLRRTRQPGLGAFVQQFRAVGRKWGR